MKARLPGIPAQPPPPSSAAEALCAERKQPAIRTGLLRRLTKLSDVPRQAGRPLRRVRRIARQHAVGTDEAAVHFVRPDLMAILDRALRFAPAEDVRVRLKETDDLLRRRHLLFLEDAAHGLLNDLLHARPERFQRGRQSLRLERGVCL